ncbi:MAG: hypothetical protein M3336_03520, partial [Chloroflexota bacterium]|nr:hypothetical protein [Chloroflexota bacterium]
MDALAPGPDVDVLVFDEDGPAHMKQRHQEWLEAVATRLGVTPDRLDAAIQEVARERGLPPPLLLPAPGTPADAAGTFSIRIDSGLGAAASALGLSEDQLRREAAGRSLADIARAHNVEPGLVAEALKAQRRADIDAAVAQGK